APFPSTQDFRQLQGSSQNYSFQNVYAAEGLTQDPALAYARNLQVSQEMSLQVSLAVGHLGCSNFSETVVGLGQLLRSGIGSFGNSSQEAKMFYYSEIRSALKMRFADKDGEEIRARVEEGFLLLMDSVSSLDFSNPNSLPYVSQLAASVEGQYQSFVESKGLSARYNCGMKSGEPGVLAPIKKKQSAPKVIVATEPVSKKPSHSERSSHDSASRRRTSHTSGHVFSFSGAAARSEADRDVPDLAEEKSQTLSIAETTSGTEPVATHETIATAHPEATPVPATNSTPLVAATVVAATASADPLATTTPQPAVVPAIPVVLAQVPPLPTPPLRVLAQPTPPFAQETRPIPAPTPIIAQQQQRTRKFTPDLSETQSQTHEDHAPAKTAEKKSVEGTTSVEKPNVSAAPASQNLVESLVSQGVPRAALKESMESWSKYRDSGKVRNSRYMVVMDLTRKTSQKRFWVLDMQAGKVLRSSFVGHGSGNGIGASNPHDKVAFVSNKPGSNASTWGAMLLEGPDRNSSLANATRIEGLDAHNRNMGSDQREIKIHSADYFTRPIGSSVDHAPDNSGRSSGCPVLYPEDAKWLRNEIPAGTFLYSFKGDIPVVSDAYSARRAVVNAQD
ncbi:MAG: murein L,D-transpeptidase catalytic domain-containing protein, partial [Bdellovibrionota bacterium]